MQQTIPCFYHPTTAVLVDDDVDFLNSLKLSLAPYCEALPFATPQAALQFLHQNLVHQPHFLRLTDESLAETHIQIDLHNIHQIVYQPQRFTQSIITIIDYDMPAMNGLELARQLKASSPIPMHIILLTGAADQTTAINAFNHQEIDRFIVKNAPNYLHTLCQYFHELQHHWFSTYTHNLTQSISLNNDHPLQDADFIALFQQICAERHIVEYYLIDKSGSFLMLNQTGDITWLFARNDEDMQTCYELAEEAAPSLQRALKKRQKIACFPKLDSHEIAATNTWKLYDAIRLHDKDIYYCIVEGEAGFGLDTQRIVSYDDFRHRGLRAG